MFLTREEESILEGENGPGYQKAMEILVALGKIFDAQDLVPIASAHLSGVSYKTIGEGGLSYLRELRDRVSVKVRTTLNPAGMDMERWNEMGVSEEFARKQLEIIDCYRSMGVDTCCTCTPYLSCNIPTLGEHVSWAESNALSYVNSVIGAMTNREGGPGALSASLLGRTPRYGLHLKENRRATAVIEADIEGDLLSHSLLGQVVGRKLGSAIPYFVGISPGAEGLKTMAAAMAASGAIAMFHVEGITPESGEQDLAGLERLHVSMDDIEEAREQLTTGDVPDLIALGCPHLTVAEVRELANLLKGRERRGDTEVWFCTNREVVDKCKEEIGILEGFGKVLCDTCMVVAPIEEHHSCTGTNSAKACNYLPGLCHQRVVCDSAERLMELIS